MRKDEGLIIAIPDRGSEPTEDEAKLSTSDKIGLNELGTLATIGRVGDWSDGGTGMRMKLGVDVADGDWIDSDTQKERSDLVIEEEPCEVEQTGLSFRFLAIIGSGENKEEDGKRRPKNRHMRRPI